MHLCYLWSSYEPLSRGYIFMLRTTTKRLRSHETIPYWEGQPLKKARSTEFSNKHHALGHYVGVIYYSNLHIWCDKKPMKIPTKCKNIQCQSYVIHQQKELVFVFGSKSHFRSKPFVYVFDLPSFALLRRVAIPNEMHVYAGYAWMTFHPSSKVVQLIIPSHDQLFIYAIDCCFPFSLTHQATIKIVATVTDVFDESAADVHALLLSENELCLSEFVKYDWNGPLHGCTRNVKLNSIGSPVVTNILWELSEWKIPGEPCIISHLVGTWKGRGVIMCITRKRLDSGTDYHVQLCCYSFTSCENTRTIAEIFELGCYSHLNSNFELDVQDDHLIFRFYSNIHPSEIKIDSRLTLQFYKRMSDKTIIGYLFRNPLHGMLNDIIEQCLHGLYSNSSWFRFVVHPRFDRHVLTFIIDFVSLWE